ncbi:MAG: hypothetical protein ACRDQ7_25500 [Haloechinothrix sp.]
MTKLRGLALTLLLLGVLCALVPILGLAGPAEVAVSGSPATATPPSPVSMHQPQEPPARSDREPAQVEPGPVIDPENSERANNERVKNKFIVGAATVLLLGIVIWGRRVRKHRRHKAKT